MLLLGSTAACVALPLHHMALLHPAFASPRHALINAALRCLGRTRHSSALPPQSNTTPAPCCAPHYFAFALPEPHRTAPHTTGHCRSITMLRSTVLRFCIAMPRLAGAIPCRTKPRFAFTRRCHALRHYCGTVLSRTQLCVALTSRRLASLSCASQCVYLAALGHAIPLTKLLPRGAGPDSAKRNPAARCVYFTMLDPTSPSATPHHFYFAKGTVPPVNGTVPQAKLTPRASPVRRWRFPCHCCASLRGTGTGHTRSTRPGPFRARASSQ